MLDEIRAFFEELRNEPQPPWPEGVATISPVTGEDIRALSEHHWQLARQRADDLETRLVELYDAGADTPALIDLMDEVVAIIRRKDEPKGQRVWEIGQLMQKTAASI